MKRPLPESDSTDEPHAKRQKSIEDKPPRSIADKVAQDGYDRVDAIISDLKSSITDQLAELRYVKDGDDVMTRDSAVASVLKFKKNAFGLFKRELSYPRPPENLEVLDALDPTDDLQSNASGNVMLSVFGEARGHGSCIPAFNNPSMRPVIRVRPSAPLGKLAYLTESRRPRSSPTLFPFLLIRTRSLRR